MSYMTYLMILPSPTPWEARQHPQHPSKPLCPYLKFEQLYIAKLVQMLSNLVHMLEWPNKASRPNGTRFGIDQLDQITSKPFLFKCKFEQLYITNFLSGASNFVSMINTPNDDATPSGASRGDDQLDSIKMKLFLLISRVHQSYIGQFLQMSPNLVKHPISK